MAAKKEEPFRTADVIGIGLSVLGLLVSIAFIGSGGRSGGGSPGGSAPSKRLVDPGGRVLLLGDSIAVGTSPPLFKNLQGYGATLSTDAAIGRTIQGAASAVAQHPEYGAFPIVLLSLGSNDAAGNPSGEGQALDHLLAMLRGAGAQVFWVVPPSFFPGAFTPKQTEVANLFSSRGVRPLPTKGPPPSVLADPMHLHPTPAGYQQLAAQIFDALTTPTYA